MLCGGGFCPTVIVYQFFMGNAYMLERRAHLY